MDYSNPTLLEATESIWSPSTFGAKWTQNNITYKFATTQTEMGASPPFTGFDFVAVGADDALRSAMAKAALIWSDYSELKISESNSEIAEIKVGRFDDEDRITGSGTLPPSGQLYMSAAADEFEVGSAKTSTLLHEIGHVLGLWHSGYYNHSDVDTVIVPRSYQDSSVYSIMSYFGPGGSPSTQAHPIQTAVWTNQNGFFYSQTPMMNDIWALQKIYGADETTRNIVSAEVNTADTCYGFNTGTTLSIADKNTYDFNINKNPVLCIYDAGGENDTINLNGWSTNTALSLFAGSFSNANGMTMNISIAHGTIIERAATGNGNDILLGNDEDNLLVGNGGDDIIYGGAGNDTLRGGQGNDTLFGYFGGVSLTANAGTSPLMTLEQMELWNAHARADDASEIDVADYSDANENNLMSTAITIDMRLSSNQVISDGFGTSDTLIGIEKILGTKRSDVVYLAGDTRTFIGGAGNDTAYGDTAHNDFDGGLDNDIFFHVSGMSNFTGGNGNDTLDLSYASGSFEIDLTEGEARKATNNGWFSEPDITFSGVESFFGSAGDDTFIFDDAFSTLPSTSKFDGKGGINTMDFSERELGIQLQRMDATTLKTADGKTMGNFQKFVGTDKADSLFLLNGMKEVHGGDNVGGVDTLDIRGFTGGIATRYLETNTVVASGSGLVATGFENIIYNSNQLRLVGTDNPETFAGTSGVDWIYGQGGNDIFQYSAGNDYLWGGAGHDTFYANKGDVIDGGTGHNAIYLSNLGQTYTSHIQSFTNIQEWHFTNVEFGGKFQSQPQLELYFVGDRVQNIEFTDASGYKHVELGAWDDKVSAFGEGYYNGGSHTDTISFGAMAGLGRLEVNKLTANSGTVTWNGGSQSLEYFDFEHVQWRAGPNGITVNGNDLSERFLSTLDFWAKDIFNGGGGNDTLIASGGDDRLNGGAGSDTFVFQERNSRTVVEDFNYLEDSLVFTWTPDNYKQTVENDDIMLWSNNRVFAVLEGAAGAGDVDYSLKSLQSILNSTSGIETNAVSPSYDDWMFV